jgi:hypothetical protein
VKNRVVISNAAKVIERGETWVSTRKQEAWGNLRGYWHSSNCIEDFSSYELDSTPGTFGLCAEPPEEVLEQPGGGKVLHEFRSEYKFL